MIRRSETAARPAETGATLGVLREQVNCHPQLAAASSTLASAVWSRQHVISDAAAATLESGIIFFDNDSTGASPYFSHEKNCSPCLHGSYRNRGDFHCFSGGAASARCDQVRESDRGAFVGAMVFELPGGVQKRRLAENGGRKSHNEIHFRLCMEHWGGRSGNAREIRACSATKRHGYGGSWPAHGRQNQAIRRTPSFVDPNNLDLQRR